MDWGGGEIGNAECGMMNRFKLATLGRRNVNGPRTKVDNRPIKFDRGGPFCYPP